MALPNSYTYTLQDVVDEIVPSTNSLSGCFTDAVASRFDPLYEGSKDRLSNFRNYGYQGTLSLASNVDTSEVLVRIHGPKNEPYFFGMSNDVNIYPYASDNNGLMGEFLPFTNTLHLEDMFSYSLTRIFVIEVSEPSRFTRIRSLSWDRSTGNWTNIHSYTSYYGYPNYDPKYREVASGYSSGGYIYTFASGDPLARTLWDPDVLDYVSGPGDETIDVLTVNISGTFSHLKTNDVGMGVYSMAWVNGYLLVGGQNSSVTTSYLRTYSLNNSTGVLTQVDSVTVNSTYNTITKIEHDGEGLVFCSHIGSYTYITSWRVDASGNIEFKDANVSGGRPGGIGYSSIRRTVVSSDGSSVFSLRTDSNDDYILEDTETLSGNKQVHADNSVAVAIVNVPVSQKLYSYKIT